MTVVHCLVPTSAVNIGIYRVNCPCPRTGPKSERPTFKYNICFNSTHRTSRSQSNHSQEPCEWFGHDLQVLFVKLEQILHLKVDRSDFGPVRDRGSLLYLSRSCSGFFAVVYRRYIAQRRLKSVGFTTSSKN